MAQFGTEDVDRLIDAGHGDAEKLAQVRRAIMRSEVISASEHDYVMRLMAAHFGPRRNVAQGQKEKPRQASPPMTQKQRTTHTAKAAPGRRSRGAAQVPGTKRRWAVRIPKRTAIIAIIVVAVAISAGAYGVTMRGEIAQAPAERVALMTDMGSYNDGDIIIVSGHDEPGATVSLSIEGPGGALWESTAKAGPDGAYSAMEFAGGEGWQAGATHTVSAAGPGGDHTAEFLYGAAP